MTNAEPESALSVHARARTEMVRTKIWQAMKEIEIEIDENGGVYPHNGARLSLSEVCRRAGVHKITMQGPSHKTTTKVRVLSWIAEVSARLLSGRKARRTITTRADDWRARFDAIASRMHEVYAIEIPHRDAALSLARARISELEAQLKVLLDSERRD